MTTPYVYLRKKEKEGSILGNNGALVGAMDEILNQFVILSPLF